MWRHRKGSGQSQDAAETEGMARRDRLVICLSSEADLAKELSFKDWIEVVVVFDENGASVGCEVIGFY